MSRNLNRNSYDHTKRRMRFIIIVMVAISIAGIVIREIEYFKLSKSTDQLAILTVTTIKAVTAPAHEEIILPGNVAAWHTASIYARTNGYIKEWKVDIGARVKVGDVLAVIEAPEVNAQLLQTEADLKTAEANNELAKSTAKRWIALLKTNSVSKQEADVTISDAKAKQAIVASMRANRDRLRDLVNFQRVVAPFDGIIMSRTTDVGRLINSGSGSMLPLFRIVQYNRLRVYVRVPQNYASSIVPTLTAQLHFSEHPDKIYSATLLDTAKAIDPNTRTLLIQLVTDNQNNELLPGGYVKVNLQLPEGKNIVRIPVNTLLFRADGLQVATIDGDHKVVLKPITIGRDFGDFVEVTTGIKPNETVILNPPDSILTGQEVQIVEQKNNSQENEQV